MSQADREIADVLSEALEDVQGGIEAAPSEAAAKVKAAHPALWKTLTSEAAENARTGNAQIAMWNQQYPLEHILFPRRSR